MGQNNERKHFPVVYGRRNSYNYPLSPHGGAVARNNDILRTDKFDICTFHIVGLNSMFKTGDFFTLILIAITIAGANSLRHACRVDTLHLSSTLGWRHDRIVFASRDGILSSCCWNRPPGTRQYKKNEEISRFSTQQHLLRVCILNVVFNNVSCHDNALCSSFVVWGTFFLCAIECSVSDERVPEKRRKRKNLVSWKIMYTTPLSHPDWIIV